MIRKSITVKLGMLLISLVAISLLAVGFSLHQLLGSYYYRQQKDAMLAKGEMLAGSLASNRSGDLAAQADILGQAAGTGIMIIDRQGRIISCSSADAGMMMGHAEMHSQMHTGWPAAGMHLNSAEVQQVLAGSTVVKRGVQAPFSSSVLTVSVPIKVNNEVTGAVILFAPEASLNATTRAVDRLILYAGLGAVILATILALFAARRVTRPLKQMSAIARQMASGDFSGRVPVTSADELGELSGSFNLLAGELARTIADLSREKETLDQVIKGMTDGVLAFESDGGVLFSNPQANKLLALSLTPGEMLPAALLAPLRAAAGGEGVAGEIEWCQRILAVRAAPLRCQGRHKPAVVAILQDITAQKQLEQMRKEFLASVSHELRTPLSFIQGYAEALADGLAKGEKQRQEYINIILAETNRLRRLVDDLFDLNKMAAGHLSLELAPVDVQELLGRVAQKYQQLLAERDISLEVKIAPALPLVNADVGRLEQILVNLLDNARYHTPPGGKIAISASQAGKELAIRVTDTGSGIPEEEIPYIWERFYKVDKSRCRSGRGSGLGLAIVKSLAEAHDGRVEVMSAPGKGSTFSIYLPCRLQTG